MFFGAWSQPALRLATVLGLWGALVIGGIYMTRVIRNTLHGPLPERWNAVPDAGLWRKLPYALLLACLLVFGFLPRLLTDKINPDAQKVADSLAISTPGQSVTPAVYHAAAQPAATSN